MGLLNRSFQGANTSPLVIRGDQLKSSPHMERCHGKDYTRKNLKGTLQEIPHFNCLKPAMSRPNTQNLKPPASITKKLQTFQNDYFSTMKILKDFHC